MFKIKKNEKFEQILKNGKHAAFYPFTKDEFMGFAKDGLSKDDIESMTKARIKDLEAYLHQARLYGVY